MLFTVGEKYQVKQKNAEMNAVLGMNLIQVRSLMRGNIK